MKGKLKLVRSIVRSISDIWRIRVIRDWSGLQRAGERFERGCGTRNSECGVRNGKASSREGFLRALRVLRGAQPLEGETLNERGTENVECGTEERPRALRGVYAMQPPQGCSMTHSLNAA